MIIAYDEILDFVTSAPTLQQIVDFQHAPETLERVYELERLEHAQTLSKEQLFELKEFRKAAYFIEQLKIRAQRRLNSGTD